MLRKLSLKVLFSSLSFLCVCHLSAGDSRYDKYFEFLKSHQATNQHIGSYKHGEIEIVQDKKMIMEIEEMQKARLLRKGASKDEAAQASKIGIVTEDEFWIWVRDGVIFPTGAKGTYNRIVWKREMTEEVPRVAILPLKSTGKIVLNLNYRHALRKWVLEIPRGFKKERESNEAAVERQLKEETGYELVSSQHLGNVSTDSGLLSSQMPIFLVKLGKKCLANQDFTEAILRSEEFTVSELKKAISEGVIELDIKGKKEKVTICDSYLAYAILLAETKGCFSNTKQGTS